MILASLLRPFRPAAAAPPAIVTGTQFRSCARTHAGHVRRLNEDRLLDRTESACWAVADGMGGHAAGDVAASTVIRHLAELDDPVDPDHILTAIEAANAAIHDDAHRTGPSGSTIAALHLDGDRFSIFWAGDSRVYRFGRHGLERLSRDHSLVQQLVDAGALDAESARHHPQANVITRAIGSSPKVEIETRSGRFEPGDVFLLCSDGLSGAVPEQRIEARLSLPIEAAADQLLADALAAGGTDNITLIVVAIADR